jgi:hypothetical protein
LVTRIPQVQPTSYSGVNASMNGIGSQTLESIPVTSKFKDDSQKAKSSMMVLGGGAILGPALGRSLDAITGAEGPLVKWSQAISNKTPVAGEKFATGLSSVKTKIGKLFEPLMKKFVPDNLKAFKEGFHSNGGLQKSAETAIKTAQESILKAQGENALKAASGLIKDKTVAKALQESAKGLSGQAAIDVAKEAVKNLGDDALKAVNSAIKNAATKGEAQKAIAQRTLDSIQHINKTNIFGRAVGKTGLFLKKNLTGSLGIINGLFAAMTVNSVIQAKKGEKFSTLMEDVLGTWVGSLGGFRFVEAGIKGLDAVLKSGADKGILVNVAKVVNKVPAKGFLLPLAGAIIISSMLQKVSHKLFGKPTKEQPKTIESVEDFNSWMKQMGWSHEEMRAIRQAHAANNPGAAGLNQVGDNEANNQQVNNQANGGYSGYMPTNEVPQAVFHATDPDLGLLDQKIQGTLSNIAHNMKLAKM